MKEKKIPTFIVAKMGCLKLTYNEFEPALKVVHKNLKISSKSCAGSYRYGFQGQESDDEVKGDGNSVNYKYRMHDPRIGRFFSVDPLTREYPHYTPYSFSGNKVIAFVELEGCEEKQATNWNAKGPNDVSIEDRNINKFLKRKGLYNGSYFNGDIKRVYIDSDSKNFKKDAPYNDVNKSIFREGEEKGNLPSVQEYMEEVAGAPEYGAEIEYVKETKIQNNVVISCEGIMHNQTVTEIKVNFLTDGPSTVVVTTTNICETQDTYTGNNGLTLSESSFNRKSFITSETFSFDDYKKYLSNEMLKEVKEVDSLNKKFNLVHDANDKMNIDNNINEGNQYSLEHYD